MSANFAPPPDIPAELLQVPATPEQRPEPLTIETGVSAQIHQTHDAVADLNLGVQADHIAPSQQAEPNFTPSFEVGRERGEVHHEVLATLSGTDAH